MQMLARDCVDAPCPFQGKGGGFQSCLACPVANQLRSIWLAARSSGWDEVGISGQQFRQRGDSNPCGQSPMDF